MISSEEYTTAINNNIYENRNLKEANRTVLEYIINSEIICYSTRKIITKLQNVAMDTNVDEYKEEIQQIILKMQVLNEKISQKIISIQKAMKKAKLIKTKTTEQKALTKFRYNFVKLKNELVAYY